MSKKIILLITITLAGMVIVTLSLLATKIRPEEGELSRQTQRQTTFNNQEKPKAVNEVSIPAEDEPALKNKEANEAEIDTSDWKIYRNEEYGFGVKYPPGWNIASDSSHFTRDIEITPNSKTVRIYKTIDEVLYELVLLVKDNHKGESLASWLKEKIQNQEDVPCIPCPNTIEELKQGEINGIRVLIADDLSAVDTVVKRVYIGKDNYIFVITIPKRIPHTNFNPLECETLQQILLTFKFVY